MKSRTNHTSLFITCMPIHKTQRNIQKITLKDLNWWKSKAKRHIFHWSVKCTDKRIKWPLPNIYAKNTRQAKMIRDRLSDGHTDLNRNDFDLYWPGYHKCAYTRTFIWKRKMRYTRVKLELPLRKAMLQNKIHSIRHI